MQAFVNTLDIENGVEELTSPDVLRDTLVHLGLLEAETLSEADLRTGLEAREALRDLALANSGVRVGHAALRTLERVAQRADYTLRFAGDEGARLVAAAPGIDGALGRILAAAFAAMLDGSWQRLKACPRDVCGWAFYDRSTNASATWCSMRVCGGRVKAGAYYRRRRAAG